ncbi:hypothetical protein J2X36_002143 [Methylobacterium sp. BE186]|uniref:phage capsid family protein n=1 Tax=Methylobacterium sp. BE186 TaxID=2817715 RepID=UPI00286058B5|nr:DUF4043 family protein [Methylobacterium sp. BE186]MDR7037396.1 hypothetical protein [Methylobacterium sp. BE186]
MAETRVNSALSPTLWDDSFNTEFYQANPLAAYMGAGRSNPIVVKEDFSSQRGNGITFEFITNFKRGTIYDRQPLRGHEDVLGEYGDKIMWRMRKKGVSMHELDRDLAAIDLRKAAKSTLQTWAEEDVKWEAIDRLMDVGANADVPYATSTAADRNAWVTANADRVLFGNSTTNYSSTMATALANVDSTNDLFTLDALSNMKTLALQATPRITPLRVQSRKNRRYFVAFAHPLPFRDFKKSGQTVQSGVVIIEKNEELFSGGDREWDGVIVHEMDDATVLTGAGAAGTNVYPVHLLGQEALGMAVKSRYASREQKDDYGQVEGLGMIGKWGMKKLVYSSTYGGNDTTVYGKQRGVFTGFFAASSI